MIYRTYDALRRGTRPVARLLDRGQRLARDERNPLRNTLGMRALATAWELQARALKVYGKPRYDIRGGVGDLPIAIAPVVVDSLPFADLLNFNLADGITKPKVLIAAALSGHHATLLQDTVETFAKDFDTYITDWKDAREVPLEDGDFGFDDYVDYLMQFMETLGPGTHMVATCQAAPPAMVAAAVLTERGADFVPATLTLMGGPIDTQIAPNVLTRITDKVPLNLFKKNNVLTVPGGYPGSGRRVYPGFLQLAGFVLLNPKPHFQQYARFVKNSLKGDQTSLQRFRDFYDEYFAVLDMTESFYIQTLQKVFFEHHIPNGQMTFEGKPVDFGLVHGVRLLTVEGANDNLCPPGQTEAAHVVFANIPASMRKNYVQPGVGHYGVFSGSRFRAEIYPVIRSFIREVKNPRPVAANEPELPTPVQNWRANGSSGNPQDPAAA
ncbi:MAG: polyhydroxyalkanoate depolymerase [Novosphingobium sp.]